MGPSAYRAMRAAFPGQEAGPPFNLPEEEWQRYLAHRRRIGMFWALASLMLPAGWLMCGVAVWAWFL
jgi:hypothetical protein